ncbi:MAG: hypothetical protein M1840_004194 [Geoglossum simile]|nr:MAG: hypothetical protein M1840_004194 [Geoglossum simile]
MAQHTVDHGLGLSDCSWPSPAPHPITHIQPRSHHPSQIWPGDFESSTLSVPGDSHSSQPPDIFSTAYDPFASMHSSGHNGPSYSDSPYPSSVGALPDVRVSPVPSCCYSHRSSYSSPCPPSEAYSRDGSEHGFNPEVKREDSNEWASSPDNSSQVRTTFTRQELLLVSQGSSRSSLAAGAYPRENSPEDAYQNYDGEYKLEPSGSLITNAARIRKRRQLTSPNEANHECPVCGKLFGRSYNFKAHMETHDPSRAYPHVCDYKDCEKKFVRKTDLTRHQQSVHIKQRNYQCGLCGNLFARKDTLRRHTEDGCAKRFDITSKALKGVSNNRDRRDMPAAQPVMTSAGIVPMRTRNPNAGMSYETSALFSRQNSPLVLPSPLDANSYSIAPRGITW